MQSNFGINISFCHLMGHQNEEGDFIGSAMGELVLKLTTMTRRNVIQLDSCINWLPNFQSIN